VVFSEEIATKLLKELFGDFDVIFGPAYMALRIEEVPVNDRQSAYSEGDIQQRKMRRNSTENFRIRGKENSYKVFRANIPTSGSQLRSE